MSFCVPVRRVSVCVCVCVRIFRCFRIAFISSRDVSIQRSRRNNNIVSAGEGYAVK